MSELSLYERLGGYDAISAVAHELLPRLQKDSQLGRFWAHRGADGIAREKQLLIDFLCANAGSSLLYTGRDMKLTHLGMKVNAADWSIFLMHLGATLESFDVPTREHEDVISFAESLKSDIVEC